MLGKTPAQVGLSSVRLGVKAPTAATNASPRGRARSTTSWTGVQVTVSLQSAYAASACGARPDKRSLILRYVDWHTDRNDHQCSNVKAFVFSCILAEGGNHKEFLMYIGAGALLIIVLLFLFLR